MGWGGAGKGYCENKLYRLVSLLSLEATSPGTNILDLTRDDTHIPKEFAASHGTGRKRESSHITSWSHTPENV